MVNGKNLLDGRKCADIIVSYGHQTHHWLDEYFPSAMLGIADLSTGNPSCRPWYSYPKIKKVIFNGPATIVFWTDGDKTVVKAEPDGYCDPYTGIAMAMLKKLVGNEAKNHIKKYMKENNIE
ncbi:MAG: hypothetical protein KBT27_09260 [Prevotellaceae bacterium]|nr:hypothetical protein [Candidatus Faecinaster equi]